jgi:hypothetical protein
MSLPMRCARVVSFGVGLCLSAFAQLPNDSFQESMLDSCRWWFVPTNNGIFAMQNGLVLTSDGTQPYSQALVYSQYYAPGDFDVQVDYALGAAWSGAIVPAGSSPLLQGAAFSLYFDGQSSLTVFRMRLTGSNQLILSGTVAGQQVASSVPSSDQRGTLRIRRTGTLIEFMSLEATSWVTVGTYTGPVRSAVSGLLSANVNAMNSVTTTFRNFRINSGATNFQAYQLPGQVLPRPDFMAGFDTSEPEDWSIWGMAKGYNPYPILAANGVNLMRMSITTMNVAVLQQTPFSQWGTLPWNNDYWSSLQEGGAEMAAAHQVRNT